MEIEETPLIVNVLSGLTTQMPTPSVPLETRPELARLSVPLSAFTVPPVALNAKSMMVVPVPAEFSSVPALLKLQGAV